MNHKTSCSTPATLIAALATFLLALLTTVAWAADSRPIRVLGDDSYPPISYVEEGIAKGFDVDVLNALGAATGRHFDVQLMSWDLAQNGVREGKADVLIGMSITAERKKSWDFSTPTLSHSFSLFVTVRNVAIHGIDDLGGKRVGVTAGGLPREYLSSRSRASLVVIADYIEGFTLLKSGSIDAVAADSWVAGYVLNTHRIDGIAIAGEPFATLDSGIAVPKGDRALLQVINRGLAQLRERGTLDEIRRKWEPKQVVFLLREQIDTIEAWGAAFAALLIVGGLMLWIVSLRKETRARRKAQDEMREALAQKEVLLENALVGIVYLRDQRIVQCNAHFARLFGGLPAELIGRTPSVLFATPEEHPRVRAAAIEAAQSGEHFHAEIEFRRSDGTTFWGEVEGAVRDSANPDGGSVWIVADTTARRSAELSMKESEARFRAIFENSSELLGLVSLKGTLLEANRAALELVGATREEVVGRPFWELPWWREPADQKNKLRRMIARAARGESVRSEAVHYDTKGQAHHIDFTVTPVCDANGRPQLLIPEGHDVTERMRAMDMLRRLAESTAGVSGTAFFRSLVRCVAEILDVDCVFIAELMPSRVRARTVALWTDGKYGDDFEYDLAHTPCRVAMREGMCVYPSKVAEAFPQNTMFRENHIESYIGTALFDEHNRPIGMLVVLDDKPLVERPETRSIISIFAARAALELLRIRDESERLALDAKLRQAQKMESIGHFAGGIAHDFNNVLAIITGFVGLSQQAAENLGDARLGGYLDEVAQAVDRASAVVAQLLAFSRSEEAAIDAVIVEPVVRDAVKLMRSTMPASLAMTLDIEAELPDVRINPVQLHQVLTNLIINARDAMQGRGRLAIRVDLEQVVALADCTSCRHHFDGDFVVLEVADEGPGITPENLSRIFDPFFTTKELGMGTGLGLSVVHGIVHAANGHLVVSPAPGGGARFRIYLPALASHGGVPLIPAVQAPAMAPIRGRVLVVDDEPQLVAYLREFLEQSGCEVNACTDPQEALARFSRDPESFDLLITDQTMPGLSGSELARACLALRPGLPVILCTGYSNQIDPAASAEIGIRAFMQKPIPASLLATTVRNVLSGDDSPAMETVMPQNQARILANRHTSR